MNINHITFSPEASTLCLYFHGCNFKCKACIRKRTLKNFIKVYNSGIRLRTESIFIPEYIDYVEISKIAEFMASVDKRIPYRIDRYVKVFDLYRKPSPIEVEKAADIARTYLRNVSCLRGDEKLRSEVVEVL